MTNSILLYIGSALITLWGAAHIIPTKAVVRDFAALSDDNRRIVTMEWVAEGLTLCFIGILVFVVTLFGEASSSTAVMVYRASALMLVVMAAWTFLTGARTSILPIKVCPYVKVAVAALFFVATLL